MEGHVSYRLNANPSTLDPALITDVTGAVVAAKLFNGLIRLGDGMTVVPDIASHWQVSADGKVYSFFLRPGVRFSNGREVLASDFKFSFQRILDPKTRSPNAWVFDSVDGAAEFFAGKAKEVAGFRVVADHIFEIRLKRPFSPFLNILTMSPCYVVPREVVAEQGPDFSRRPAGTGPFILRHWHPDREIVLERRQDYFDGRAAVDGIVYRIIPEDLTAVTEFELGNLDVLALPASAYARFRGDKAWKSHIFSIEGLNTYYLGLNASKPPFSNADMRRAVSLAIDREKIRQTFFEGRGRLAGGPVPDLLRTWRIGAAELYNPALAKEIARRSGMAGRKVNFFVTADQEVVDLAEIIQSYLRAAGIDVVIRQLEWSAFKEAVNRGEPDLFWLSWWADYPDPENFLFPLFHSANHGAAGNRTRYINAGVDALIEGGRSSKDLVQRDEFYRKAEEIINRDVPWVSFWHKTDYVVVQSWVQGYRVHPIYTMDKGMDISLKQPQSNSNGNR